LFLFVSKKITNSGIMSFSIPSWQSWPFLPL
jgi:hypothetical protein